VAAAGAGRKHAPKHVVTAGRWLIQAQNAPLNSPEQFMFYYLSLETLTTGVKDFLTLKWLRDEAEREAPELLGASWEVFATEVKRNVRVRFGVLARSLFPEQAKAARGPWRSSKTPALALALSARYFSSLALPSLAAR
jgi:hypothetical protein